MTEEQLDYSGQSYKYKREVRAPEAHPDKGGDAEEFRRVYVLKKMFDKWSEAVLGYSWWGTSPQEYQGHQSRRHLPRSGPLQRQR